MRTAKTLGAAWACVGLLSCASEPVVTAQNYKTGVFTVCGNSQASKVDLAQRAAKVCTTAAPTVVRCTADVKYPTVGIQGEMTLSGNCCDYECPPQLMRQASLLGQR
ncbi:MAG: hypothetical protein ACLQDQ_08560 [Myxococcaceae bacterium]